MASSASTDPAGPWDPLALPAFRAIWLATVISNVGTSMQDVGATWLMLSLDDRPTTIALLQACATLPIVLFGLPAGVLADIVDRRRLLIFANGLIICAASGLSVVTFLQQVDPSVLLLFTLGLSTGAALSAPAFQAVVPELAPGPMLSPGVALNSLGVNIARTIGPGAGGLLVSAAGPAAVFALNAVSTLAVLVALLLWKREARANSLPPEHFFSAVRMSVRYVANAPAVLVVLARTLLFFVLASATWAMLPLLAYGRLEMSAAAYGAVLGALGAGAIAGAFLLPKLRTAVGVERTSQVATALCAIAAVSLAFAPNFWFVILVIPAFGFGWIGSLTILNINVQSAVAGWVRARVLAVYVVVLSASMAAGSLAWGQLAALTSPGTALLVAGAAQGVSLLLMLLLPFKDATDIDTTAAGLDTAPLLLDPDHDHAPVLVTTDYRVPVEHTEAFLTRLDRLAKSRRRAGAMGWWRWSDASDATLHRETYLVESWTDFLRIQSRQTRSDAAYEAAVVALTAADETPVRRLFRGPDAKAPRKTS